MTWNKNVVWLHVVIFYNKYCKITYCLTTIPRFFSENQFCLCTIDLAKSWFYVMFMNKLVKYYHSFIGNRQPVFMLWAGKKFAKCTGILLFNIPSFSLFHDYWLSASSFAFLICICWSPLLKEMQIENCIVITTCSMSFCQSSN